MLRTRALSALVLVPPLLIALAIGIPALAVVLAIVAALGAWEAFRLLRMAGYPSLSVFGTVLAVALVLEAAWRPGGDKGLLLVAAGAVLAGIGALARTDPRDGLLAWMATVFGAVYVGLLAFVLQVAANGPAVPAGAVLEPLGAERGWVLLLVLAVWSFDTGAYLVGRQIGRHRFLTHISPSKTIEGVVGGLVATTIVCALMLAGLGQQPAGALVLGPVLGLAAQAGDLAESMIKRAAGAKDSGTLIPGHGGILDRIDSFLFAGPVVALYVLALAR
ncbi:MAG TPA: phosphatidate cytidylyltransferase [Candidatus Limnocylindrales bacterium]|jgi:phosphatidate cytidylyltransferase